MTGRRALAIGEALIDEYPDRRVVAGAPLHVLAHLASLGWDTALITRVGDDADGLAVVEATRAAGVNTDLVETDPALPTGTTLITMLPDGSHAFAVRHPAAWDAIVGPAAAPDSDVLVFGTLALRDPRTRATVERLAAGPATRVVDLNLRAPHFDADTVRWALGHADIVKATADEATAVADLPGVPALESIGAEWVAITRGADGASLRHAGGGFWSMPAPPTAIVDTIGAGDAFLAALVDGLIRGSDPGDALRAAVGRAADTLGRRGGMPSRPGESDPR